MNWIEFFFKLAKISSEKSKDKSTKVGAVIVGPENEVRSLGFNGIPRGVQDLDERQIRPEKYHWFEHAERNAIYNAARSGIRTEGCRLFLFPMVPCTDCARAIIQSGIKEVYVYVVKESPNYAESNPIAMQMLTEAGVKVTVYKHEDFKFMDLE